MRRGPNQPGGSYRLRGVVTCGPARISRQEPKRSVRVVERDDVPIHDLPGTHDADLSQPVEQTTSNRSSAHDQDISDFKGRDGVRAGLGGVALAEPPR